MTGDDTDGLVEACMQAIWQRRQGESALELLDRACAPFRGKAVTPCDELHPHPAEPLGQLLVEAFATRGLADLPLYGPMVGEYPRHVDSNGPKADRMGEDAHDRWLADVFSKFRGRYGLMDANLYDPVRERGMKEMARRAV